MSTPERPDGPPSELRPLLDVVLGASDDLAPGAIADGLRTDVRTLCSAARSRGLLVEQLLVLVKDAWWRRADVREVPRSRASEGLACLVTVCIDEFYRDGADDAPGRRQEPR